MVVAMPNIFDVFADEDTRSIFESLIKTKRADLRTIRGSLSMSEDKATAALERLGNAGFRRLFSQRKRSCREPPTECQPAEQGVVISVREQAGLA
jgi:hypothetical protein